MHSICWYTDRCHIDVNAGQMYGWILRNQPAVWMYMHYTCSILTQNSFVAILEMLTRVLVCIFSPHALHMLIIEQLRTLLPAATPAFKSWSKMISISWIFHILCTCITNVIQVRWNDLSCQVVGETPDIWTNLDKSGINSAYAYLTRSSRGPINEVLNRYALACEAIAWVPNISGICRADVL